MSVYVTRIACAAAVALAVAGCGRSADQDEVRSVVATFYDAVRAGNGDEACALLSAGTAARLESQTGRSCASAVTRLDYEGGAVIDEHVYLTSAKVDLRGGDSAFLSQEDDGWRISALACVDESRKPRDVPYDCEVES